MNGEPGRSVGAGSLLQRFRALKSSPSGTVFRTRTLRDLLLTELVPPMLLVVSSDSDGGIGPKQHDAFACPAYVLGRFGVRVPLMECIAAGAVPLLVVDVLSVEMIPTGEEIIRGVRDEVTQAGLDGSSVITGSTEDNVPTVQTGMGVVVIGLAEEGDLRPGSSRAGDQVVCIGLPKSAPEDDVRVDDPGIADVDCVRRLAGIDHVHDILPVGSHGVEYEFREMARTAGLAGVLRGSPPFDLGKSGGPSTCVLASLPADRVDSLRSRLRQPVHIIGELKNDES
ncbi:MAG TPA: hypothetical protein ENI92_08385 [Bacteroidetes bacterium]|nr:hypothetical protein [Bacteroidota bacterium]